MQSCPSQTRSTPAEVRLQYGRQRPADRAGKAGEQGHAADCTAGVSAMQANQRRERSLVQAAAHADAEHPPGNEQADRARSQGEQAKSQSEDQVCDYQHRPTTKAVDGTPGIGSQQGGDDKRGRERCKDKLDRHAELTRHRCSQYGREVVGRRPGKRLAGPESSDGRPARRRIAGDNCRTHVRWRPLTTRAG